MKYTVIILVLVVLAVGIYVYSSKTKQKDFMETFKTTENAVLVDIRTPEEFSAGHIPGALSINYYDSNFLDQIKAVGTDKKFFIYCRSGSRSQQASMLMKNAGLWVTDLPGGISAHPELLR